MKDFRVIGITDSTIKASNQRVLVFDLAEVQYSDHTMPSGAKNYNFGMNGVKYVFAFNSPWSSRLTEAAHNERIVSLNESEFISRNERENGVIEKVYYHNSVKFFQGIESSDDIPYEYKAKELNGQQLAMLTNGIMKSIFPKPKNEELLVKNLHTGSCRLYFQKHYFKNLIEKINDYYLDGSFATSNAYEEWTDLKKAIEDAEIDDNINIGDIDPHFLTE